VTSDAYDRALAEGGKMKLRAGALLAFGDDESRFQAAVLLHEAVRAERRALVALSSHDPQTLLRFAIERCGALLDGLDPLEASRAWGEVLIASEGVPADQARALRARIDPKYARQEKEFGAQLRKNHLVLQEGALVSTSTPGTRARKELAALLKVYPGVADLWFRQCRLFEREGRILDAWRSLERARQLMPEEPAFEAAGLWLAPRVLSLADVSARYQSVFAAIRRAPAEVCLFYALGEAVTMPASESSGARRERAGRVRRAAIEGQARQGTRDRVRRYLRALELLADAIDAGSSPSDDSLYRAGLGDLVVSAPQTARRDPVGLLARSVEQTLDWLPVAA
jgi:hypothetical protein